MSEYKSVPPRCSYCALGRCKGTMTLYHCDGGHGNSGKRRGLWLCTRGAPLSLWLTGNEGIISNPNITMDDGYYIDVNF